MGQAFERHLENKATCSSAVISAAWGHSSSQLQATTDHLLMGDFQCPVEGNQ